MKAIKIKLENLAHNLQEVDFFTEMREREKGTFLKSDTS